MGHEKGIEILRSHPELDVLFQYTTADGIKTFVSDGIAADLKILQ